MLTQFLIFLLMLFSGTVFIGQVKRWDKVWFFICLYWFILTVKNAVDFWNVIGVG